MPETFQPILFFVMPPGGFFLFAIFISFNIYLKKRQRADTNAVAKPAGGV
jgi:electron transport complex protein RnfE